MRLSTRGEYGLLALVDLALFSGDRPLQAKQIAERQGIPKLYLDQLMMDLKKAGLVVSVRGREGGYQLARPANSIWSPHRFRQVLTSARQSRSNWAEDREAVLGSCLL